jgi:acyl-coenzyme A synthetase/AMP-(fatty) acid ligase
MSTFYDLIFDIKKDWDKELLITNIGRYSLHDLHSKVDEWMNILRSEGELKGKKVAALIPNLADYFSLLLAVNKLGGTFIPLSHQYRNDDLTKVLNLTRPNIVFTIKEQNKIQFKDMVTDWAKTNYIQTTLFSYNNGVFEKEHIQGNEESLITEQIDLIVCTSGSTGVPKGIKYKVNSLELWTKAIVSGVELWQTDRIFLTIPITAVYGISWILTCLIHRIQMVIAEKFDVPIVINLLNDFPCNKMATTPSLFKAIYLFAKQISPITLNSFQLVVLAGELISDEFKALMKDFRGCRLINNYGLSEVGTLMYAKDDIRSKVVEGWSISDGVEYKVNSFSDDGIGELMIKSLMGFDGYYLNDELTREVLTTDGWFYTGDLVRINDLGHIEIIGRKKQLIKKGGVQVIPGEVEQVLNQHPKVLQSAVVGIPHSVYGEEVVAFIISEDDLNLDDLFSFVREKIANFKVPGKIIRINEMPITQGKLDRVTLRKIAMDS